MLMPKKEFEEVKLLDNAEGSHDDLQQYTRKFNLVIDGIPEREEENNEEDAIKLGKLLEVNLTRGHIDIVRRMKTKSKSNRGRLSSASVTTT